DFNACQTSGSLRNGSGNEIVFLFVEAVGNSVVDHCPETGVENDFDVASDGRIFFLNNVNHFFNSCFEFSCVHVWFLLSILIFFFMILQHEIRCSCAFLLCFPKKKKPRLYIHCKDEAVILRGSTLLRRSVFPQKKDTASLYRL